MKLIIAGLVFILMVVFSMGVDVDRITRLEQQVMELVKRVEVLETWYKEAPLESTFSGRGNSQTMPFTVTSSPWRIRWRVNLGGGGGNVFVIWVCYPENPTQGKGYGFYVSGNMTGETTSYLPAGTYFFSINTADYVVWEIEVED